MPEWLPSSGRNSGCGHDDRAQGNGFFVVFFRGLEEPAGVGVDRFEFGGPEDGELEVGVGFVAVFARVFSVYPVFVVVVKGVAGIAGVFRKPVRGAAGAFIHDDELSRPPCLARLPEVAPEAC